MGFFVPETMKKLNNWGLWKLENGKKIPYSALYDGKASVTKPQQWANYSEAFNKLQYTDDYNGLGFLFTANCGLVFIDIDNCIDESGEPSDFALSIIELFRNSYIEYSQSGKGLHIICKGVISAAYKKEIEVYSHSRYMAFTGNVYQQSEPQNEQAALNELHRRFNIQMHGKNQNEEQAPLLMSDKEVIARSERGGNGSDFNHLYNGDWKYKYQSQSQADLRLVSILWYYSRNAEQVTRIFLSSGLGQREKAKRSDYIPRLIKKVAENMPDIQTAQKKIIVQQEAQKKTWCRF